MEEGRYTQHRWSAVINDSDDYFWGNNWNISFTTHLSMDTQLAKLSVGVSFNDPTQQCPHPYFRTRLSGIAIVHIPMDTPQYNQLGAAGRSNPSKVVVNGSVWIPTPGRYFLEILLLHCTMDAYNTTRTSDELKRQCPLLPVIRKDVKDYSFTVDPFDRPQRAIDEWEADPSSPSLFQAWVFAPPCSGSIYHVSAECTKAALESVNMVRTKVQLGDYLQFMHAGRKQYNVYKIRGRFDNYVFLPVDRQNGSIDYSIDRSSWMYAEPVNGISTTSIQEADQKLCFIGDSFADILFFETIMILANTTAGTDPFDYGNDHSPSNQTWDKTVSQMTIRLANDWFDFPVNVTQWVLSRCTSVFVTVGRWDNGYPDYYHTTPLEFKTTMMRVLQNVESLTPSTTKTYVLSSTPMALGLFVLRCDDWRVSPMTEAYDSMFIGETALLPNGVRAFRDLSRTYYMDNTDLEAPLWDDPDDWMHPCRHVSRPVVRRLLSFVMKYRAPNS